MGQIKGILVYQVGSNTVEDFVIAFALFLGLLIVFWVFRNLVLKKLKHWAAKTRTTVDDEMVNIFQEIPGLFYYTLAIYLPLLFLAKSPTVDLWVKGLFIVIMVYEVTKISQHLLEYLLKRVISKSSKDELPKTTFYGIRLLVRGVLWSVAVLLILSNLGFDITSLVASLGIGGVAVALAVQSILGDIFSSFTIYFDRPFQIGDYIVLSNGDDGFVRHIGLKTTRITTLNGEELVVSNNELTNSRIRNFKKMEQRRILQMIGVEYGTSTKLLKLVPDLIKKIVDDLEEADFIFCHFLEFGDFSLNFQFAYHVNNSDKLFAMSLQEKINLAILDAFEKEGIEIAFPTQKILVEKQ